MRALERGLRYGEVMFGIEIPDSESRRLSGPDALEELEGGWAFCERFRNVDIRSHPTAIRAITRMYFFQCLMLCGPLWSLS